MPIKKKLTKKTTKKTMKKVSVDRKFLLNLANSIYDRKTRKFLRLCDGKLQNGPDPTNPKRPMHCGLGELYFAMTGLQPESTGVNEDDVINLAVKLSPLDGLRKIELQKRDEKLEKAESFLKKLELRAGLTDDLVELIKTEKSNEDDEDESLESQFRSILDEIPGENDDGCGDEEYCSIGTFRERSKRVAEKLREAAALLPK